jgi:hypothetical protein
MPNRMCRIGIDSTPQRLNGVTGLIGSGEGQAVIDQDVVTRISRLQAAMM